MFCWMASFLLLAAAAAARAAAVSTLGGRFGIAEAGGGSIDEPRFFLCGGGAMVGSPGEIPPAEAAIDKSKSSAQLEDVAGW